MSFERSGRYYTASIFFLKGLIYNGARNIRFKGLRLSFFLCGAEARGEQVASDEGRASGKRWTRCGHVKFVAEARER